MKSERRHELEKNDLADRLAKGVESLKPYQNALLAGAFLILIVAVSYGWWVGKSQADTEDGWNAFYAAMGQLGSGPGGFDDAMSEFDDIIKEHPNSYLGRWAMVVAADLHLQQGCNLLFENKPNAHQELKRATELYEQLREQPRLNANLRQRALYGLARATEARGREADLEKAKELYEELKQLAPEGVYAAEAAQRAKDLAQPDTIDMYADFAKFDPSPAPFLEEPGFSGDRPLFDPDTLTPPEVMPPGGTGTPDDNVFSPPLIDLKETGSDDEPAGTPDNEPAATPDDAPAATPDKDPAETPDDAGPADPSE